jgi:hypothetical protein
MVHLWERGVVGNELCGCGAHFAQCDFWQEVGNRAFGGWGAVDARMALSLERAVNRHRFIPLMVTSPMWPGFAQQLRAYRSLQASLYRGIRDVSGCRVIVDSSKSPPHAFLLSRAPGVKMKLLHLVRDSRGVAHSWTKRVLRPEVTRAEVYMPRYHPARAAADWVIENLLFQALGARTVPYVVVRYESLARRARDVVEGVVDFADGDSGEADLSFIGKNDVVLDTTHSVAGNPMRFHRGHVSLRLDEDWRHRLSMRDRFVVSTITWPLLTHYGYRRSRG